MSEENTDMQNASYQGWDGKSHQYLGSGTVYGIFVGADGADGTECPVLYKLRDFIDEHGGPGDTYSLKAWAFDRNPADMGWRIVTHRNVSGDIDDIGAALKESGVKVPAFEYPVSSAEFHDRNVSVAELDFDESRSIFKVPDSRQLLFVEGFERMARQNRAEYSSVRIADTVKSRCGAERARSVEAFRKATGIAGPSRTPPYKGSLDRRLGMAKNSSDMAEGRMGRSRRAKGGMSHART
jgi:hypothetical protein